MLHNTTNSAMHLNKGEAHDEVLNLFSSISSLPESFLSPENQQLPHSN